MNTNSPDPKNNKPTFVKNFKTLHLKIILATLFSFAVLSSCLPRQELNYMQDIDKVALENSLKNSRSTLQPGDQLIITVSAKDLDVVKPFNQNYSSTATVTQYSAPSGNVQMQQVPSSGPTYMVDVDGNIFFPQIGKVDTRNENVETFRIKLQDLISKYVKEPIVDVKLVNFKVSILGEVKSPGTYVVPDGKANILQALGMAGDLTQYGIRENILILRNIDGNFTQHRINITSAEFINSPYYYVRQNDMIYVESNTIRQRASRVDPNTGLYISVASVLASLVFSIIAITRN